MQRQEKQFAPTRLPIMICDNNRYNAAYIAATKTAKFSHNNACHGKKPILLVSLSDEVERATTDILSLSCKIADMRYPEMFSI